MEIGQLVNLVRIKDLILSFFESQDILKDIKQECDVRLKADVRHKEFSPIYFTLKISFYEIKNQDLLHLITRETDYFLELAEEIIHFLVKSYFQQESENNSFIFSTDEIICNFRFFDVPLETYKFSLRTAHINCSLSTFRCIIQRVDPIVKYIRQSSWKCYDCFNAPLITVKNRAITHKAPKCAKCLKACAELPENRITSEYCTAFVFESDYFSNFSDFYLTRTIEVRLFDDLCQELKIGQEYIIVGKYEVLNKFFNVYSILLI